MDQRMMGESGLLWNEASPFENLAVCRTRRPSWAFLVGRRAIASVLDDPFQLLQMEAVCLTSWFPLHVVLGLPRLPLGIPGDAGMDDVGFLRMPSSSSGLFFH